MTCGAGNCGSIPSGSVAPVLGRIRNLAARPESTGEVQVSWEHEHTGEDPGIIARVVIDGTTEASVLASVNDAGVGAVSSGTHTLHVCLEEPDSRLISYAGDTLGQAVFLDWSPSTDADCRGYKIYRDGSLVTTVDTITVEPFAFEPPHSGTGAGRASIGGNWLGTLPINTVASVEIDSNGDLAYTIDDETGTVEWSAGVPLPLPYGVEVVLHDDAEDYQTGDTWEFRIGPETKATVAGVAGATDAYTVKPYDVAGNLGSATSARTLYTFSLPSAVSGVAWDYDSGTDSLTISWDTPGAGETVGVYANWNAATGNFEDYIREDNPLPNTGTDETTISFNGETGDLKFYVWKRKEYRAGPTYFGLLTFPEWTINELSIPPTAADLGIVLGTPYNLTATPGASGAITITWNYDLQSGDDATDFEVYAQSGTINYASAQGTALIGDGTYTGGDQLAFTKTLTGPYSGTITVAVRAFDVSNNHDGNTITTTVVADSTAPTMPATLGGCTT